MSNNPAKIKKNGHYKQGYYKPTNPEKYLGDPKGVIIWTNSINVYSVIKI